ncbi:MAG: DUF3943 domain-containing protein [Prevotella sp.]|nr:DUF3943 domain-containing protein [Prevotella sp.]
MKIRQLIPLLLSLLLPRMVTAQHSPVGIVSGQDSVRMLQLGLISSVANNVDGGLQLSSFSGMATGTLRGIQLSGVNNIAMGVEKGIQLSALLNVSSGYMRGLQLSGMNFADSLNGTQIGVLNVARTHPKGWQIGLINVTRDTIAHKLGLVNVNPNTTIDYMVYGGTATKGNAAVRFRNRSTYNIIGLGTHYMGLDEKFSGALFYRLGQYFQLSPRWSLGGDLGYYHIETFEHHKADKPDQLFSLQARLTAEYQINRHLGVFATVGYGDTRYYHHASHYRSRMLGEVGLTWRYMRSNDLKTYRAPRVSKSNGEKHQQGLTPDALREKHPWWALAQVTAVNAGVHLFDRFVLNEDFAKTTMHTWRENFENGFVWDNDLFSTNLFMHPYHGNLYYNSARSQGLNFWQSAPFAMMGSLQWEFLGEVEPPAVNDLIATTIGGICIGEVTHRISRILLNDRCRGWNRFCREAAATLLNPMGGLKRIVTGDAWRVSHDHYLYHDREQLPIDFSISAGNRYLADEGALFRGEHNPYLNLYLDYGDPVNEGGHNRPYDYINADVTFGMSSNQPIINRLHFVGRLWSAPMLTRNEVRAEFGIYQHFDYLDSKPVKDGTRQTPYRISEAAAFGPGAILQLPAIGVLSRLEQRTFLNAILLGGTKSDYYSFIDRDYNMGSGFSIKSKTHLEFNKIARFIMHAQFYQIFTWKGYEQKDLTAVDPLHLNSQGDKGHAQLLVVNPMMEVDLKGPWSLAFSASYFSRATHYKYYDDVKTNTFETRLGLTCHF